MKKTTGTSRRSKVKPGDKVAILVLGMHRSGTSMLSGVLDCLGCKGPNTPMKASEQNPKGFFESQPIFRLNDEILEAAGTGWDDWKPQQEGWLNSPRFNEFHARAMEVLRTEYDGASMIYLKDPRICRLLPLWRRALEETGYRVVCIHTHRHPLDVATSLRARTNIEVEPSLGMLSWLRNILEAEAASRDLPRIFTSYASVIQNWQEFSGRAEAAFDFTWPVMARTAQEKISEFIELDLRHHNSNVDSFLRDPLVPDLFRKTLQILESWVQVGEKEDDYAKLDKIHDGFDFSAPLLFAPVSALESKIRDVKALTPHKASAEARQNEVDALSAKLADTEGQRDQLSSQKEQLRAELDQNRADMEEVEAQAQASKAEVDALSAKLADTEEHASKLSAELTTWTERLIDRDKKIAILQKDADLNRSKMTAELLDQQNRYIEDIEKAKACAEASKAEADALTVKLTYAEERVSELSDEMTTWAERLIDRDKKNGLLQKNVDLYRSQMVAELRDLQNQHDHVIESIHNTYRSSTSWKISAPLRIIKSWFSAHR